MTIRGGLNGESELQRTNLIVWKICKQHLYEAIGFESVDQRTYTKAKTYLRK